MDIAIEALYVAAVAGGAALARRAMSRLTYFFAIAAILIVTLIALQGVNLSMVMSVHETWQESGDLAVAMDPGTMEDALEDGLPWAAGVGVVGALLGAIVLGCRFIDTGASRWWALLGAIPYLGTLVAIVMIFVPPHAFGEGGTDRGERASLPSADERAANKPSS